MITIKQLFDWVKNNRRKTAFSYPDEKLLDELVWCCDNDSLLVIFDDNNNILGIVCWKLNTDKKILHVMDILTIRPGVVKTMMKMFQVRFDGYTIEGFARGVRHRTFNNTTKLLNRL